VRKAAGKIRIGLWSEVRAAGLCVLAAATLVAAFLVSALPALLLFLICQEGSENDERLSDGRAAETGAFGR
jgi:hypothetical protein